jgi:putative tryptophan/tyrosine transport system ATP-binding protein
MRETPALGMLASGPPALEVRGLHHVFHRGGPNELQALAGVDLALERGGFVVVLGVNGSGKSTLLNAIAGSLRPDRGSILLDGSDVTRLGEHVRARRIGRVFQDPLAGTAPRLTIADNLALAARRSEPWWRPGMVLDSPMRAAIAERVAELGVGLEGRLGDPIGALSAGQRQALTLLMATFVRPALLLLDEHTSALDPHSAEQVLRLTQSAVGRESLTTLMVTQSMQHAVRLGTRVIMMHRGRIVQDFAGSRKRRLRVQDLLDCFEQVRNDDLLDDSAAEMLRQQYV